MDMYVEIKLRNLYPHPAIVAAVDTSLVSDAPEWYQQFSDEMLQTLQQTQPAHVLRDAQDAKKYFFFAGWQLFHEFRRREIDSIYAVLHKLPPPNIEKWAVMAALGISGLAKVNEQYQASAFQLLSEHKNLWPTIFSGDRPRTPTTALERLCGISRAAAQRVATPPAPKPTPSLLEAMLANQNENSCDQIADKNRA